MSMVCAAMLRERESAQFCVQIASMVRATVSAYNRPFPAILEIPSKDCPYDPTQDSILSRVQFMFGAQ